MLTTKIEVCNDTSFGVVNTMIKLCTVKGCHNPIRAVGMCKNHRQRFLEYGRLEKVVTGVKIHHPLYGMWNKRKQKENAFVKEWLDFDKFLKDVGEKPKDHFLATLDLSKPCGPNNFEWRKIKLKMIEGETPSQYSSRYSKIARKNDPNLSRKLNYKYNFGISLEEVEIKLAAQNYVCAICGQPEIATYKNTNKIKTLALDHCHKTGKLRDFLCSKCNLFLGKFEDNLHNLDKFHSYLDKHK